MFLSSGVYFIRSSEPIGVDGSYISIASLGILALYLGSRALVDSRLHLGGSTVRLFIFWLISATVAPTISSALYAVPYGLAQFIIEIVFCGALFLVAYILVRTHRIDPISVIMLSAPWLLIVLFAFVSEGPQVSSLRRLDTFDSINYAAASSSALMITSITLAVYFSQSRRLVSTLALLGSSIPAYTIFLSGSRSPLFGIMTAVLWLIFVLYFRFIQRGTITKESVYKLILLITAGAVVGLILGILYRVTTDSFDLSLLLQRYSTQAIAFSFSERLDRWGEALPSGVETFLLGAPWNYVPISSSLVQYMHPHNQLMSLLHFCGILAPLLFSATLGLIYFRMTRIAISSRSRTEVSYSVGLTMSLTCIVLYTLTSGHFTRNWHLYWLMGLAAGYADFVFTRGNFRRCPRYDQRLRV